jgi:hypothetical protein
MKNINHLEKNARLGRRRVPWSKRRDATRETTATTVTDLRVTLFRLAMVFAIKQKVNRHLQMLRPIHLQLAFHDAPNASSRGRMVLHKSLTMFICIV